jgi:ankyrin repeat protein
VTAADEKWKWLFRPLGRTARARLEVCLGVVVTGAAMVALSTVIHVDPARLAALSPAPSVGFERRAEADLRAVPAPGPTVAPEFAHAVARGDLATMARLHTPGMALDGMLALAAESGERPVALWLLEHGADVHEDEGSADSPILLADQHPDMVAFLLEHGAAESSLTTAAEANASNAVLRLLAAHANVNPADATPLTAAVASTRGTAESKRLIIDKLLAAGADPNRDYGENPLTAAVRSCDAAREERASTEECLPIIKVLVKHGARAQGDALAAALAIDDTARAAPLEALLAAPLERGATAVALAQSSVVPARELKQLVAKGVDWAWHDGEDDAALPLFAAVQRGDRDFVRALLDVGAPANVHFKDGTSPLGAAIDGTADGGTPSYARIVELLVARGVDVNRRLPDGRTPLFAAAESGDLRVVTALLDRGARVNDLVLDDTALDVAEQHGHQPAARILHARGARRARKGSDGHADGL